MLTRLFHAWERRLATVDTNRVVRPFDWGLDWLGIDSDCPHPLERVKAWAAVSISSVVTSRCVTARIMPP